MRARRAVPIVLAAALAVAGWRVAPLAVRVHAAPQATVQTPEQFLGFRVGTDNKLVRWDKIVEYMRTVAEASPRVNVRELGKSTSGNPFIVVEISSADTLQNLDHFKAMERKPVLPGRGADAAERDEIFRPARPSSSSRAASTRRRSARRRCRWSSCTGSRPTSRPR